MRKQLDPRLPILINNNVKLNHRSFIVLVGDKGRDQIVNLHFLLSQARVSARPSVLWCYKKELGFTTHRKKREAKIKREVKKGIREPNEQNPFEIFVTVTDIRYTYYKESHKILGNTYGMLVLQDFEAITPNLLARTIETVEGGGLVVLLLKTMTSLKQLYSMTMDVHSRYRTSSHHEVTARFNERFILSLGSNPDCLFLDDELNVLPISRGKDIVAIEDSGSTSAPSPDTLALKQIQASLSSTPPAGPLVSLAKTSDQAKALLTFIEAIQEKTLSSTVTLTAGRGRGKSASLGLAIAGALACGYSNVFVTSPSPENLKAVFEFVFKGLDALGYEEHLDYDIAQSTNPEFGNAIVRVNVFRDHRQTVQYIAPEDAHVLGQAELVVIDEAAAIPLPLVKQLIGPYLVFMASTINGYEGTGRSLSLKLIQQLRESTRPSLSKEPAVSKEAGEGATTGGEKKKAVVKAAPKTRTLREVRLDVPIRYSTGDKIESWLNGFLCLDATVSPSSALSGCPHPSQCELYEVSRDTLFSYHPASEVFLQRMMALYVASHYKNQPNDLQLMSDAPAHALFVLLPPLGGSASDSKDGAKTLGEAAAEGATHLPEPLVVLQVALEGSISRDTILDGLGRGVRPGGDMIPWLISQQFQEPRFGKLSGARVVRVAVHPDYANMGYGSRALQALNAFYSGEYYNFDADGEVGDKEPGKVSRRKGVDGEGDSNLLTETPTVRSASSMPPLLQRLSERKPENLDYLGVSYGLTPSLLRFWKRAGYVPLYVRQTASDLTGEHTCVMLRGLNSSAEGELEWLGEFAKDFRRRFISLLSYKFREFGSVTALSILEAVNVGVPKNGGASDAAMSGPLTSSEMAHLFTAFDLKRLEAYANNTLDYHVIQDLFPAIASLYFAGRFDNTAPAADAAEGEVAKPSGVKLTAVQSSILLALGLQRKAIEDVERELSLPVNQALALLVKIIRKISKRLVEIQKAVVSASIPDLRAKPSLLSTASTSRVEHADDETEDGGAPAKKPVEEWQPSVTATIEKELEEAGGEVDSELRERQKAMLESLDLSKFAINDAAVDWDTAAAQVKTLEKGGPGASTIVSLKSTSTGSVGQKRKASTKDAEDEPGAGVGKKNRRSKKVKR